jgi:hypothetical protein
VTSDERTPAVEQETPRTNPRPVWTRTRRILGITLTVVAAALVWFALVAPNRLNELTPSAFARIPIEGLALCALCLVVPVRVRRVVAVIAGLVLGGLIIVKALDMGFYEVLDRPFNPVTDWSSFGPAIGVFRDSVGDGWADAAVVGAIVLAVAMLIALPISVLRLAGLAARHRAASARGIGVLALGWAVALAVGVSVAPGQPVASTSAANLAYDQVHAVEAGIADQRTFASELRGHDSFQGKPADQLLTGLRGKDVIIAFVESYGQVAVQGSSLSRQVDAVLQKGTRSLDAAGFHSRSAFLTSPTFGGISWLAHSTLQSGLWIDSQQRYDQLVESNRLTLSDAFRRAGWRTVADVASNGDSWPEGRSFFHYDKLYDAYNVGYRGPTFSYASMPDQYILSTFQRRELAHPHRPVMAEIDLVSSHTPWAPLPHMVPWNQVGNGSVFDGMPDQGQTPDAVWSSGDKVRAAYGQSIRYSLTALISFVRTFPDPDLVLVVLGDHQPATVVSGSDATHNVPISIIAHNPDVLARIDSWDWQPGLLPHPGAPIWTMDAFRDRFLSAYGPQPGPIASH